MTSPNNGIEPATVSDILGLATWERQRSDEELREFISSKAVDLTEIYESLE